MSKFRELYWKTLIIKEEIVSMLFCLRAYYKKKGKQMLVLELEMKTTDQYSS